MAWFVTLASKMTGKEISGVGKAPGGKIKKDAKEVGDHLKNFVAIAVEVNGFVNVIGRSCKILTANKN